MNEFNIKLFKKAIIGLNDNLETVGEIFHSNIHFFASNLKIEDKKKGINSLSNEIAKIIPEFKKNYSNLIELYDEVEHNISEKTENRDEYVSFMKHISEFFPSYINDINHCIENMESLDIKTPKYIEVTEELSKILLNDKILIEKFLNISETYLN